MDAYPERPKPQESNTGFPYSVDIRITRVLPRCRRCRSSKQAASATTMPTDLCELLHNADGPSLADLLDPFACFAGVICSHISRALEPPVSLVLSVCVDGKVEAWQNDTHRKFNRVSVVEEARDGRRDNGRTLLGVRRRSKESCQGTYMPLRIGTPFLRGFDCAKVKRWYGYL